MQCLMLSQSFADNIFRILALNNKTAPTSIQGRGGFVIPLFQQNTNLGQVLA